MSTPRIIGRIPTVITHLEMFQPPDGPPLQPPVDGIEVVRALQPTLSFYRYLYNAVGGGWLWCSRHLMTDQELTAIITAATTDIRVIWRRGVPAGYAEFDSSDGETVQLAHFGLLPEFLGQGLGRFFIDWSIRHAFTKSARRLYVHTCDLDHPRALGNYEAAGFTPFDREEGENVVLEGMPIPEHARDRPIVAN